MKTGMKTPRPENGGGTKKDASYNKAHVCKKKTPLEKKSLAT